VRSYTIEILPTARKELLSHPGTIQKRIGQKIDSLKNNARPTGVKALKSKRGDFYRLRVGDYRILYEIRDKLLLIIVIKIGHRREVYRKIQL
jgi:mRNA interferase RelE/StbE